jgi:hypothetical protein
MKHFILLIVASVIFGSCATTKKTIVEKVKEKTVIDSTGTKTENISIFTDTTKVSNRKVKITQIEFFDPDRNKHEHKDRAINSDQDEKNMDQDGTGNGSVHRSPSGGSKGHQRPAIKSITITEIDEGDSIHATTAKNTAVKEESTVKRKTDRQSEKKAVTVTQSCFCTIKRWTIAILFVISLIWLYFRLKK